ncbi:MAG: alpha/beta hydrolase [Clostridiaceae bacterium]
MPSLSAQILKLQLRLAKPLARFTTIEAARLAQDQLGRVTSGILKTKVTYEDVSFERFQACFAVSHECIAPCDRVILYLHGGGYTAGQLDYAKGFGGVLAAATRISVFCVAYRLAPENKFPAALDDALEAYRYLLDQGFQPQNIAFVGESAGGGLEYCLLLRCKDEGLPMPKCAVAISPWTDLTFSGASYFNNILRDPTLIRESLAYYVLAYAAGHEGEAYVSPVFGDMEGLPKSLIFVGSDEILFDDAKTLAKKLSAGGVPVELVIGNGLWHVYPLYGTPESRKAVAQMSEFVLTELGLSTAALAK